MNSDVVYPLNKLTSTYQEINSEWLDEETSFIRFYIKESDSIFRCVIKSTTNKDPNDNELEKFKEDLLNFLTEKGEKDSKEIVEHVKDNLEFYKKTIDDLDEFYDESKMKKKDIKVKLLNTEKENILETYFSFENSKDAYPLFSKEYRNLNNDSRFFSIVNFTILDYYIIERIKSKIVNIKINNKILDLIKKIDILSMILNVNFIVLRVFDTGVFTVKIIEYNKEFPYIIVFEQKEDFYEAGGLIKDENIKLLFHYNEDKEFIELCRNNYIDKYVIKQQNKDQEEKEYYKKDDFDNLIKNIENTTTEESTEIKKRTYTKQEYLKSLNL